MDFDELFRNFGFYEASHSSNSQKKRKLRTQKFSNAWSDPYGEMFEEDACQSKGSNVRKNIDIDFLESINGTTKDLSYTRKVICPVCRGKQARPAGNEQRSSKIQCKSCNGEGYLKTDEGDYQFEYPCLMCKGLGVVYHTNCAHCDGYGIIKEKITHQIRIPKFVATGFNIKISGKGNANDPYG